MDVEDNGNITVFKSEFKDWHYFNLQQPLIKALCGIYQFYISILIPSKENKSHLIVIYHRTMVYNEFY